jgi:prepilin-type processing-associated H-X9-DG protein
LKLFLCPTRRTTEVGAVDDYGSGHHPDWWYQDYPFMSGWYSILGGPYASNHNRGSRLVTKGWPLPLIVNGDGTSNTLLLAHKGLAPAYYEGGSPPAQKKFPSDVTWAQSNSGWEHRRNPLLPMIADSNDVSNMQEYFGSPHSGAMPCLFADGSVRTIRYEIDGTIMARLWAWNDGQIVSADIF